MRGLEVKTALANTLAAWGGWPAGTIVNKRYATENEDIGSKSVRVTRTRLTSDFHALGGLGLVGHKQEVIVCEVVCSVRVEGDDQETPETDAWALAEQVDLAIEATPQLGLSDVGHPRPAIVTSARGEPSADPGGWVQQVILEVTVDISS